MNDYIVVGAATSSLLEIAKGLFDAGHRREGVHILSASVRIALENSLVARRGYVKRPHGVRPMESLIKVCQQEGLLSEPWHKLLNRVYRIHETRRLEGDFDNTVRVVRQLLSEIDDAEAKTQNTEVINARVDMESSPFPERDDQRKEVQS